MRCKTTSSPNRKTRRKKGEPLPEKPGYIIRMNKKGVPTYYKACNEETEVFNEQTRRCRKKKPAQPRIRRTKEEACQNKDKEWLVSTKTGKTGCYTKCKDGIQQRNTTTMRCTNLQNGRKTSQRKECNPDTHIRDTGGTGRCVKKCKETKQHIRKLDGTLGCYKPCDSITELRDVRPQMRYKCRKKDDLSEETIGEIDSVHDDIAAKRYVRKPRRMRSSVPQPHYSPSRVQQSPRAPSPAQQAPRAPSPVKQAPWPPSPPSPSPVRQSVLDIAHTNGTPFEAYTNVAPLKKFLRRVTQNKPPQKNDVDNEESMFTSRPAVLRWMHKNKRILAEGSEIPHLINRKLQTNWTWYPPVGHSGSTTLYLKKT